MATLPPLLQWVSELGYWAVVFPGIVVYAAMAAAAALAQSVRQASREAPGVPAQDINKSTASFELSQQEGSHLHGRQHKAAAEVQQARLRAASFQDMVRQLQQALAQVHSLETARDTLQCQLVSQQQCLSATPSLASQQEEPNPMPAVLEDRMMAMEAAHAELIRQLSSSRRSLQQAQLQLAAMQQAWSMEKAARLQLQRQLDDITAAAQQLHAAQAAFLADKPPNLPTPMQRAASSPQPTPAAQARVSQKLAARLVQATQFGKLSLSKGSSMQCPDSSSCSVLIAAAPAPVSVRGIR